MEGACGRIISTDDPTVVIKHVYRRNRPQQRSCSLRAEEQARMQEWARGICVKGGFQLLFVPRAWDAEKHSYKMDRIQVDKPLELTEVKDNAVLEELKAFYAAAMAVCIFPLDYELYIQPNGTIAMVDFDKFSSWHNGTITFPWGVSMKDTVMRDQYPFLMT